MQKTCQNFINSKITTKILVVFTLLFSSTFFKASAQCPGTVNNGGTISASTYTGYAPLTVTINNDSSPYGDAPGNIIEYMYIVVENGVQTTYNSSDPSYTLTLGSAGTYEIFRCSRYVGCSSWPGESNHIYITVNPPVSCFTNLVNMTSPASCGACDATVWLEWTGGSGNYSVTLDGNSFTSYSNSTIWFNGNNNWQLDIYNICGGNHSVVVTDNISGCTSTTNFTITGGTVVTADAGADKFLNCYTTSAQIGTPEVADRVYSWYPSDNLSATNVAMPTASPLYTTTYTLTVSDVNNSNCNATDIVTVYVDRTPPTVNAGPDQYLNCTTTSTYIGMSSVAGTSYSWYPTNGLSSSTDSYVMANPSSTTTYTLTATGSNGCVAESYVTVYVSNSVPTANAGNDLYLNCTTTSGQIGTAVIAGNTYSWSPDSYLNASNIAMPTASPISTTNYTVTVTNPNGCSSTDVVTVFVDRVAPIADAGFDQTIDCHTSSVILGSTVTPGYSYSWSPATGLSSTTDPMPTASITSSQDYTLTVTGSNGCVASDMVNVNVSYHYPNVTIDGNLIVCNGSMTTLTVTSNPTGTILWSTGSNSSSITVGAGTYTATVTDGTCSASSMVTVVNKQGSAGNYVWHDLNINGINDEPASAGINGAIVILKSAGPDAIRGTADDITVQSTTTANDISGNPGYYNFTICNTGNYFVSFPTTNGTEILTYTNATPGLDNYSDADDRGLSPIFNINVDGTGVAKDNPTIDAGYIQLKSLGDRVWNDLNNDGIQTPNEVGVAGITVSLFDANNNVIASTVTDAYGLYLFTDLYPGAYRVKFTLPSNYVFSSTNQGTDDALDSDANPLTGVTEVYNILASDNQILTVDAGIHIQIITSSLGDKVWNDFNFDGIQNTNEPGVSGVVVTLYNSANNPIATTVTDANGNYIFTDLTPGIYFVGFTLPASYTFSPKDQGTGDNIDSDVNLATSKTDAINLAPGENNPTIDAGIYKQPTSNASLGDKVWNDLNANGIQEPNENGVPGITVTLYAADGTTVITSTITNAFGNYIFNNLAVGGYVVGFSNLPAGFSFTTPNFGSDNTDSDPSVTTGKTQVYNIAAGQINLTVDAGIFNPTLPTASLGNKVWYDLNKNGIQEPNENGVVGVKVTLYNAANVELASTTTDATGLYVFNNLNAGNYKVGFSNIPTGYKLTTPLLGGNETIDSDPDVLTGLTNTIALANGENNLTIDAGIVLGGGRVTNFTTTLGDRVWNDLNANGIQEEGENGIQGVTVTLYGPNGTTILATTTTDALGHYIFTDLNEGSYIVGFSNIPTGYTFSPKNATSDDLLDSDADAASGGKTSLITLEEGDINLSVDAGLHAAPNLASIGNYVWNDQNQNGVQDATEKGVPGVVVCLVLASTNAIIANTTTDANGLYQFTGLNPDTYSIIFKSFPSGYQLTGSNIGVDDTKDSDPNQANGRTENVTLVAGQNYLDFDAGIFTDLASLGNFVWNDLNNNGIQESNEAGLPGITVTIFDATGTPVTSTVTDANGAYNFVNLIPGTYTVGVSNLPIGSNFSPANAGDDALDSDIDPTSGRTSPITLIAGENNTTIDAGINIPETGGLGNYVWIDENRNGIQDPTEPGLAGVDVFLYDSNNNLIRSSVTDANGAYSFPNLPAGSYSVGFSGLPILYNAEGNVLVPAYTTQNAGTPSNSSHVDQVTGRTPFVTIVVGEYNPNFDAGIVFNQALPVALTSFNAINRGCTANVTWSTSSEENVKQFNVIRDGVQIATVNAAGNSSNAKAYSYTDNNVENGQTYQYQLSAQDINGTVKLHNVIKSVTINCNATQILVYPNPAKDNISISFGSDASQNATITLFDMLGNKVYSKNVNPSTNGFEIINVSGLATGNYLLQITNLESGNFVRKIEVSK